MRFWVAAGTVGNGTVGTGTVGNGTVAMALLAIGARFSLFNWNGRSYQWPDPGQWSCAMF